MIELLPAMGALCGHQAKNLSALAYPAHSNPAAPRPLCEDSIEAAVIHSEQFKNRLGAPSVPGGKQHAQWASVCANKRSWADVVLLKPAVVDFQYELNVFRG